MNQSQYAKRIGVSRNQIHKLIKTGIIPIVDGEIDPEEADQILLANRHPSYDHNRKAQLPFEEPTRTIEDGETPPSLPSGNDTNPVDVPFHQSRAVKEYYFALTAKLEFEEKAGNLADVKKIEEQAFDLWRNYRDTWLNVASKWSGEGAAELGLDPTTGQETLYLFLSKIINATLEEFADGPRTTHHLP